MNSILSLSHLQAKDDNVEVWVKRDVPSANELKKMSDLTGVRVRFMCPVPTSWRRCQISQVWEYNLCAQCQRAEEDVRSHRCESTIYVPFSCVHLCMVQQAEDDTRSRRRVDVYLCALRICAPVPITLCAQESIFVMHCLHIVLYKMLSCSLAVVLNHLLSTSYSFNLITAFMYGVHHFHPLCASRSHAACITFTHCVHHFHPLCASLSPTVCITLTHCVHHFYMLRIIF